MYTAETADTLSSESDDCIILDEESKVSVHTQISFKKFDQVKLGSRVLCLKDKWRHVWSLGTLMSTVNDSVDLSIRNLGRTNEKFYVKFDESTDELGQDIYDSDCNHVPTVSGNEPDEDSASSNSDPIAPRKRRKLTSACGSRDSWIEMDARSLAFMPSPDGLVPDLKYLKYSQQMRIMILPVRSRVVTFYRVCTSFYSNY